MDVIAELRKWNVEITPEGSGKILIRCPLPEHEDKNPSCQVQVEESTNKILGSYFCPVCRKGGDFYDLLGKITKSPASAHRHRLVGGGKVVNPKKIEAFHACLMTREFITANSQQLKRELEARGISDATIKKHLIGYSNDTQRLTIPIQWGDNFVNVLMYLPGAATRKFINYAKGYGTLPTLYPQEQLNYDKIVLCGGPLKALATAQRVNQHGIGAISICFGECKIPLELIPWFEGKTVWVCYDIDSHGQVFSDQTCALLNNRAKWVGNLLLPLNPHLYPKGDLNDYFGQEESSAEDFLTLLETVQKWEDKGFKQEYKEAIIEVNIEKLCGFQKAFNFSTAAYISGVDDSSAHKVPKRISVTCTGDAELCSLCRLRRSATFDPLEGVTIETEPRNPICLSFVGIPHRQRTMVFREYFGIPETCYKCEFKPSEELFTVRYVLLSDTQADSELPISAVVYTDGGELYTGEICEIKGRVDQSPLNSEELRIITEHKPKDILSHYIVKNESLLNQFRTEGDTLRDLEKKIDDINFDLERNVTFIYDRPQVHNLFDLAFHSPLWVPHENAIEPGWISVLLVSETAQGKSTIMRRLITHYGHGAYIDAANTSVAGLVGGIKSIGKRQFVKWGILPQMDKRLVCIEEYSNAPVELLRSMRAARDSGVVSMNKIDKGKAKARTRTIVLSNPKKLLKPNVIIDGVSLLEDLVERPEDLRRFDVGMWIPRIEVEKWYESTTPKYSSEACHELITWVWTLPIEKIIFSDQAKKAIRYNDLKDKYPFLYLVGMREFDAKLARLSASIAARTYNIDNNGNLRIELRHVEWICQFLCNLYDDVEFGYTSRIRRETDMDAMCTIDQIISTVKIAGNPVLLCDYLERYNRYTMEDLRAAIGDAYSFDTVKNKLIILGCIVPEEDTRWNNTYLPTKRLKKHIKEVKDAMLKQYRAADYLKGVRHEGSNSI